MKLFLKYFRNKCFKNKNQSLCKKRGYFSKMEDIDNNKLMQLLIIADGNFLLNQEYVKKGENDGNGYVLG